MKKKIVEKNGKSLWQDEERNIDVPYWQLLYYDLKERLSEDKQVKNTMTHSLKEINESIEKGKRFCDDCGELMELKLPKSHKELLDIILQFTNDQCYRICNKCHIQSIKDGRVIGAGDEWFPDKDKLLKKELKRLGMERDK